MSEPTTYTVKTRPTDKRQCIYLRSFNIVVAEFADNTRHAQETIGRLLDNHAMAIKNAELKEKNPGIDYLVCFGGGIGEDVWDREITVFATDFEDAAKQAKGTAEESGGVVFSIVQEA